MADEKNIETPDEIEVSEDQAAQPSENAETTGDQPSSEQPASDAGDTPAVEQPEEKPKDAGKEDAPEGDSDEAMLTMLNNLPEEGSGASPEEIDFGKTPAAKAKFQQLSQTAGQSETTNIDLLMDINLPVSIELGRAKMSIADILGLGPGSVVELNKLAGEPVDVLVNHKIVAKGEVVVIDENFGVRVTQLMTPEERLKLLGEEE